MYKNLPQLRTFVEHQQYQPLKEACQSALANAKQSEILPLLALAEAQLGEQQAAIKTLKQAEAIKDGLDADPLVDLAAAYIVLFQIDKAVEVLSSIVKSYPQHDLALARLGLCYMSQNDLPQACEYFEKSLAINPQRLSVLINLITLSIHLGEISRARQLVDEGMRCIEEVKSSLPESIIQAHQQRLEMLQLQCWVRLQQLAQAEHWLAEQKEKLDEEDYTFWLSHYATALAESDQHSQAEDALKEGLKQFPKNKQLIMQLSELAQVQGRSMQANHLLEMAIAEDKENPALWAKLSGCCLISNEKRALKAAEKAIELSDALSVSDDYPAERIAALKLGAKNALAQVKSQQQNYDEAETLFNELLAENPHFVPAIRGLGQQLMQQGDIEQAIKHYEHLKLIDPVSGHSALINARVFPEDKTVLEQLDKAARIPSLEGSVRSGILFQLAAAFEKAKDYDKAFSYAQEANALSLKFLQYDPKAHRNECARVRHAFSKALYEHRKDCGHPSTLPVYVLGMPRSGTTLVEQIIASHSDIFGAGELGVIPSRIQGLNRWERHVGSGRQYPDCVDDLSPKVVTGIAAAMLKELQEYAPDAKHIVDKLPHNFENIGFIKFLFPHAKIISVRRDPRDIAISNYFTDYQAKHGGMGFAYDLTNIGEQLADHNLLLLHWQQLFPDILEVNYEDVVNDTEAMARKMLDYIGVEWQEQVLNFNTLDRPVKTASVWQVRQPIYKTSTAKWKRYQDHLAPLIQGTNAKIEFDPIEMITLPEPGFQTTGAELFKQDDLDGAELSCKKMLHHNPEHAAANYLVGLIYCRKNHVKDGVEYLEKALKKCPWQKEWRKALVQAYEVTGQKDKAEQLQQ